MAGILEPKSRFFDTYITNEGRKQLGSGELRMRFVSFSDGLTGYEQSELGVIDPKDGSIFFESMSRPQDNIITENESIVNMLEVRSQGAQPAFLFSPVVDSNDRLVTNEDGSPKLSPIKASMFGTSIYEPPSGKEVSVVTSSGIIRKLINYDLKTSFYISGSNTQEVKYDQQHIESLVGWWQFDSFTNQKLSVFSFDSEDSNLSFLFNKQSFSRVKFYYSLNPVAGNNLSLISVDSSGTQKTKKYKFVSEGVTGDLDGDDVKVLLGASADISYGNLKTAIHHINGHDKTNDTPGHLTVDHSIDNPSNNTGVFEIAQTDPGAAGNTTITGTLRSVTLPTGFAGGGGTISKVSQNLLGQWDETEKETNAAYFSVGPDPAPNIMTSSITPEIQFSNRTIKRFTPDISKSFEGGTGKYIRINTDTSLYHHKFPDNIKSVLSDGRLTGYEFQISVWVYLKSSNFENPGNSNKNMVMQLFDFYRTDAGAPQRRECAKIYTQDTNLILQLFDHSDNALDSTGIIKTLDGVISPNTWHRISLAVDPGDSVPLQPAIGDATGLIMLTVDANMTKSLRLTQPFKDDPDGGQERWLHLTSTSDLILGNSFTNSNVLKSNPSLSHVEESNAYLNGYIQECQYFVYPRGSDANSDRDWPNHRIPALLTADDNAEYINTINSIENTYRIFPDVEDANVYTDNNQNPISYLGQYIEVDLAKRTWMNYKPISAEAALYFASFPSIEPYVSEEKVERGFKRVDISSLVESSEHVMSGTLFAYKDLRLLGHLDLNVSGEQGIDISRYRIVNKIQDFNPLPTSPDYVRVFRTKLPNFPFIEAPYGQKNDYRSDATIPHAVNTRGPAGGRFFEREATVYHLNEIMDNDHDVDDLTYSSSRLPNFMFLPPMLNKGFRFDLKANPPTYESVMSWVDFLRRRAAKTSWNTDSKEETTKTSAETRRIYEDRLHEHYKTLIPRDTITNLLNVLKPNENDSNEQLIRYLTRDINRTDNEAGYTNSITYDSMRDFNEIIDFNETSEFNNSFVQMFEVSDTGGFKKLAIKDLGIIRREPATYDNNYTGRRNNDVVSNFADISQTNSELDQSSQLSHVFAFGKLMSDNVSNTPGEDIFFFPIFTIEFILGD